MVNLIDDNGFNRLKKSKYGYCLYNKFDMYVGKSIEYYGEYCDDEAKIFSQICKNGDTVVEVGANIGTHTLCLSSLVGNDGKVYAFEPQRIIFQTLCANIALNSILNTYTYQLAVGSSSGVVTIPNINYQDIGNFGGVSVNPLANGEKVDLIKLDDFLEVDSLKFIKIDVEGMEIEVLKGAKRLINTFKPVLYIENDRIEKSQELIEFLWELGYRLYWHLPSLFNPKNYYNEQKNMIGNFISINMVCIHIDAPIKVQNMVEVTHSDFHPSKKKV